MELKNPAALEDFRIGGFCFVQKNDVTIRNSEGMVLVMSVAPIEMHLWPCTCVRCILEIVRFRKGSSISAGRGCPRCACTTTPGSREEF